MSTENLEQEDQNRTTEPIIDIPGNEAPADPEQEIVSQGVHNYSAAETYVCPTDPAVLQQLEWFRDQKLALMMHFGLYCQPGMVASWALSDKDSDWSRHQVNWTDGETFKKQYFSLNRSFNPVRFQPEEWAQMAEDCGFRYLLLTTKHHDGFCLFDSKYTDYKVTNTPAGRDLIKEYVEALREEGLKVGIYFTLLDWHHPDYPHYGDRIHPMRNHKECGNENRDFSRYTEYLYNQVEEICTNYGQIDIIWFDFSYDDMRGEKWGATKLINMVRSLQPQVIIVPWRFCKP